MDQKEMKLSMLYQHFGAPRKMCQESLNCPPPNTVCSRQNYNTIIIHWRMYRRRKLSHMTNPVIGFLLALIRRYNSWTSDGTIVSFDLDWRVFWTSPFIIRFSGAFKLFRNTKSCHGFSACFNQAFKLLDKRPYNWIIWFGLEGVFASPFIIRFSGAFKLFRNTKSCHWFSTCFN